jgi:hypothetical protein
MICEGLFVVLPAVSAEAIDHVRRLDLERRDTDQWCGWAQDSGRSRE